MDVLAITDHDTTAGWAVAVAELPAGLTLVRGAEISCRYDDATGKRIGVHLLAYLFDPAEPGFRAARAALRDGRRRRGQRMVERLRADGHDIRWPRVQEIAGGTVGRPHVARALMEVGAVGSIAEAFSPDWIAPGGRYHAAKPELQLRDAIGLVAGAGGVPVLAHPRTDRARRHLPAEVITELAGLGLRGLEVDHPDHGPAARAELRSVAADAGLFVTGSSDFHGANKPELRLAAETTDPAAYEELAAAASGLLPVTA